MPARGPNRRWPALTGFCARNWHVLAAGVVLLAAVVRLQTYVLPSDPNTYIRMARGLLAGRHATAGISGDGFRYAPGYPLILAASIQAFGLFAPYWVSPVFAVLLFVLLARLLRRLVADRAVEVLAVLATLAVVVGGHPTNPHHFLYPYRDVVMICFMLAGLLLLDAGAGRPPRYGRLLLAGVSFALACVVRELAVLGMAGPSLWLAARGPGTRRARLLMLLAFLAPFVVPLALLGVASPAQLSVQAQRFLAGLIERLASPAVFRRELLGNLAGYLALYRREMGWAGAGLLLVGLWSQRRNSRLLLFFVPTAVLLQGLYSTYFVHPRYFLSFLVFAAPFAGCGLQAVLAAGLRLARRIRPVPQSVPHQVAGALLLLWLARPLAALQKWTDVSRDDVRALLAEAVAFGEPGGHVVLDRNARLLYAALTSHANLRLHDFTDAEGALRDVDRLHFLQPLTDACLYGGPVRRSSVRAERYLEHRLDLVPQVDDRGHRREFTFAGGRYRVCRLAPWTRTTVRQPVTLRAEGPQVLWLDFRAAEPGCAKRVQLESGSGQPLAQWVVPRGSGIQAFYLDADAAASSTRWLCATSGCVLPANLVIGTVPAGEFLELPLGDDRRLSVGDWFLPPFKTRPTHAYAAVFSRGGRLRVPVPHGGRSCTLRIRHVMRPGRDMSRGVRVTYSTGGEVLIDKRVSLAAGKVWGQLVLPGIAMGGTVDVDLAVDPPDCHGNHFRMLEVGVALEAGSVEPPDQDEADQTEEHHGEQDDQVRSETGTPDE